MITSFSKRAIKLYFIYLKIASDYYFNLWDKQLLLNLSPLSSLEDSGYVCECVCLCVCVYLLLCV